MSFFHSKFFLSILTLAILFNLAFFKFGKKQDLSLLSGAPKVLGAQAQFFYSANQWRPDLGNILPSSLATPEISAKSALVVDLTTSKVLFAKNPKQKLPIASTLKILTAVVALENLKPDHVITISEKAAKTGEDFMGLTASEKLTLEELLYGLLLSSGNDAAEAIAEGVVGTSAKFVELMNSKAAILGAVDSKFVNPSGLEGEGEHYSTAVDLAVISKYAWENSRLFRRIVGTKYYEIPYTPEHKYFFLENQTNLLGTYPGVKGIKPGYTPEAGLCLVTLAENGGHTILAVILGSENRRDEMAKLLDYSFETLGVKI